MTVFVLPLSLLGGLHAFGAQAGVPLDPGSRVLLSGGALEARFGASIDPAGDVQGDGFADLVVGAPGVDLGFPDDGVVYLYAGGPEGLRPESVTLIQASEGGIGLGESVAGVGDLDGDGFKDLLFGAPLRDSGRGSVWLSLGSGSGPSTWPELLLVGTDDVRGFGQRVAGGGDLNGDGFSDAIIGSAEGGRLWILMGSSETPYAVMTITGDPEDSFGLVFAGAGDLDGDTFDDLLIGLPSWDQGRGAVQVHPGAAEGPATTPASTLEGSVAGESFGAALSFFGDLGGDGFQDFAIGSPGYSDQAGRVQIALGRSDAAPSVQYTLESAYYMSLFGLAVAGAGDIDADGAPDLLVGAPHGQVNGVVELHLGAPDIATSAMSLVGIEHRGALGQTLAGIGDVDADGQDDVAIGAPLANEARGQVEIYRGQIDGDGDGVEEYGDCDDTNPVVVPGAAEVTGDGLDQNCDGVEYCYTDRDGDGFRGPWVIRSEDADCTDPGEAGLEVPDGDCDDTDPESYPQAQDIKGDGIDQDCDGQDAGAAKGGEYKGGGGMSCAVAPKASGAGGLLLLAGLLSLLTRRLPAGSAMARPLQA